MDPKMAILAIPAALAVTGLVIHSLKARGGRETAFFFLFALLFGVIRGNTIWWITTVHFGGDFPYLFRNKLVGIFHDSFVADMGWILCLYLGAYLAYCVLERIPEIKHRLFAAVSLAALFNVTLSYAVESTAIDMGWWGWTLDTRSDLLRDVPMAGILAWFSVGFDFLIPYLLIRHYRRPGQWWPWMTLLIFPVHMLTHLSNTRVSDALPIVPYNLWHWGMVVATFFLPLIGRVELHTPWIRAACLPGSRPEAPDEAPGKLVRSLPFVALAIVLAVLLVSDLAIIREPELTTTKASLIYFVLLAIPAIPAWTVLALAGVAAIVGGKLFWAPVVVPLFYYALRGQLLWPRFPALKFAYALLAIVLSWSFYDWSLDKHELDREYHLANLQGTRAKEAGDLDRAAYHFREAIELKPSSVKAYQNLSITYVEMDRLPEALVAMEEAAGHRPASATIRENLGSIHMLMGNLDAAEAAFRKALEFSAESEYAAAMLEEIERLRDNPQPPED